MQTLMFSQVESIQCLSQSYRIQKLLQVLVGLAGIDWQQGEAWDTKMALVQLKNFFSSVDGAHIQSEIPRYFRRDELAVGAELNLVTVNPDIEFVTKDVAGKNRNLPRTFSIRRTRANICIK